MWGFFIDNNDDDAEEEVDNEDHQEKRNKGRRPTKKGLQYFALLLHVKDKNKNEYVMRLFTV